MENASLYEEKNIPRIGHIIHTILWSQYFEQYLISVNLSENKIEKESKYVVKTEN